MSHPSNFSRVASLFLTLVVSVAVIAQDISGGAGVLLASADVEAKLGKGIFTPVPSKPHPNKTPEKKPIVRAAHPRTNMAGNRTNNTGNTGASGNRTSGNARPAMDAEAYNKQGD